MKKKVLIIGLDCVPPQLAFERFLEVMPNLQMMLERGIHGPLRSCDPPITIPAWMVMATGLSPGELGIYGFRHRRKNSYTDIWLASSQTITKPTIWDIIGEQGNKVCLIGVPPSYPPPPVNGWLISCFITPDTKKDYTYPQELKQEIAALVDNYILDVTFRTDKKQKLLGEIYEMTAKRFKVVKHLLTTKTWEFFMFVEIGPDRIHHAFWKFFDEKHPLHTPGNPFENTVKNYYRYLDKELGDLLALLDENTVVFVVSDHGAKKMEGAFCINEWLIREGYLTLKKTPVPNTYFEDAQVDWNHTVAWGWGGYYARVFINLDGRETQGIVKPDEYETVRHELAEKIKQIKGPHGELWNTKVFKPEELYTKCNGTPPDLMVYFDDLSWRSAGTLGHNALYLSENDTGPDDAVHSQEGIFLLYDPTSKHPKKKVIEASLIDVAPTVLKLMGVPIPHTMTGKVIGGNLE